MKVLHIDSSALGDFSASRQLSAAAVNALREANPSAHVTYRDLAKEPPPHLSGQLLQILRAAPGAEHASPTAGMVEDVALTEALITELLTSDVLVIGAPMYNFSIPTPLKAWIDRVAQAGRTFRFVDGRPVGLCAGKKALVVSSRGNRFLGQSYEQTLDHQEAYLKAVLNFLGITDVRVVRAEGLAFGAEARAGAIDGALTELNLLGAQFA